MTARRPLLLLMVLSIMALTSCSDRPPSYQIITCDGTVHVVRDLSCGMNSHGVVLCCGTLNCPLQFGCVLRLERIYE